MIPQCINHAGHVVYEDGRVYRNYELLTTCKTFAAAKAWATRNNKQIRAQASTEHHQRIAAIHGRS